MKNRQAIALILILAITLTFMVSCDSAVQQMTSGQVNNAGENAGENASETTSTSNSTCSHSWENATCQFPKTCSVCGATEGRHTEHNWENNVCTYCGLENEKEMQFFAGKNSYELLNTASTNCDIIMDSIYGAWYFTIYEAEDYILSGFQPCFKAFLSATGLEYEGAKKSVDNFCKSMGFTNPSEIEQMAVISISSYAILIVLDYYANNGVYSATENAIEEARSELKKVTNEYSDYTNYPVLKEYYTSVSAYFDFCKSPTGSFEQLSNTINGYETQIRNAKMDLSFIFE